MCNFPGTVGLHLVEHLILHVRVVRVVARLSAGSLVELG